ncbi:MAG TPA: oligopeptide:H+ symporter [Verrucomicrobiae bacterium]
MNDASKTSRWPRQIKYIVGNEACERFSYYGMRSILAGYITGAVLKGGLGQDADTSTEIIHLFVFANYFMPLLGAWLSDKLIGRYHTILWVSLFYCAGHGVLACSDFAGDVHGKMLCLGTGLGVIAFGSGGIKPCVSAFMGDQFKPEQSHLLQKAYGAFYWAINFGSFFSFLVIPWVKDHHGYSLAFAVPGILMAIATFIFWRGTRHYVRVPTNRQLHHAGFFTVFWNAYRAGNQFHFAAILNLVATIGLPVLAMVLMTILGFSHRTGITAQCLGWTALGCIGGWYLLVIVLSLLRKTELPEAFWRNAASRHDEKEIAGARSFTPILFMFAFVPIFWTLFDQTNSTWVLQGEQMTPANFLGLAIGAEQMQSMNPLIVMLLVPLFTLGIYPRIGRFASPLKRMAFGMFLAGASYLVVAALQTRIEHGAHLSVLWQTIPYLILTAAEVLFSTTGLEFAFREAAPEMKSTIMSFWLLTVSMGDLFVVTVTKVFASATDRAASVSTGRFLQYAGMTFVVAVLFSLVAAFYQYRDKSAAQGK